MNPRLAWAAVALAAVGMVVAGVMAIAGVDQTTIIALTAVLVGPVLTALVGAQVADVKATAGRVEQNTNGSQAALLAIIREQSELLAASAPIRDTEKDPVAHHADNDQPEQ